MEKALELLRPRLMGLICEGVSKGLAAERNGDSETVRRADVVGFVEAALTVFGIEPERSARPTRRTSARRSRARRSQTRLATPWFS